MTQPLKPLSRHRQSSASLSRRRRPTTTRKKRYKRADGGERFHIKRPPIKRTASPLDAKTLRIVPLGGLGEIGKNMMVLEYGDDVIIIDVGLAFPEEWTPGIDFIIPNIKYLEEKREQIRAIIFTHGHYDHIGAFPYLRDKLNNPDIYAGKLTKGMLLKRQDDFPHQKPVEINEITDRDTIKIGDAFKIEFFHLNHNIPDNLGMVIKTPVGNIVHTSDFKFDLNPVFDKPVDLDHLRAIGDRGILLLCSDSTGAEIPGESLSESIIMENLEKIFKESSGMIVAGTFASLINRVQQLIELAERYGRKVVVDGYSMKTNVEITKKLKYVKMKKGTQIDSKQVADYPRNKICAIVTGAQGEGRAALMRIANGEHRNITIQKEDSVIFSSSVIPGNERSVQLVKDQFYRTGAKVYHYQMMDIHASGHAFQDDLKKMIELMRPKFFMPIHGQYSMMVNHGWLAKEKGIPEENIIIADNGSIINLKKTKWDFDKAKAPSNYVFVDGLGVGDIGNVVLRDRQVLSADGMFIIIATIDVRTGKVRTSPDIISRGFVYLKDNKELLSETRKRVVDLIEKKTTKGSVNWTYLKDEIRNKVGEFLFQKTERRPMVLSVIIEV